MDLRAEFLLIQEKNKKAEQPAGMGFRPNAGQRVMIKGGGGKSIRTPRIQEQKQKQLEANQALIMKGRQADKANAQPINY